jgi:hypothetical protein
MNFKDFLAESFTKEYAYRIKFAADCGSDQMTMIEQCLSKYNFVSAAPFNRTPIQENPSEFVRLKGIKCTSEVCSTDVVLKYPANPRILEVWLAVNMGLDHERVLCYGINEPRRVHNELAAERMANDVDRMPNMDDAVLANEDFEHDTYAAQIEVDEVAGMYGEDYNDKFLAELKRIRDEKGADYFRAYPTKDELMGDNLRPMWDDLHNGTNMGQGRETEKTVSVNDQNLGSR